MEHVPLCCRIPIGLIGDDAYLHQTVILTLVTALESGTGPVRVKMLKRPDMSDRMSPPDRSVAGPVDLKCDTHQCTMRLSQARTSSPVFYDSQPG